MSEENAPPARSFGAVAQAYDRARPSYPDAAVRWMTGSGRSVVLELGAGTGKLTEVLHGAGHEILATDPLPDMLVRLADRVPVKHVAATAEHIPLRSRSVDLVVCGQSFHWFHHDLAMGEIARVLRPGGVLALAWNTYDTSIPWVRRLERLLSPGTEDAGRTGALMESPYFGFVEERQFRFWQVHTGSTLADLARSVSYVSTMRQSQRDAVLAKVDALYREYGRGHDGMQLPWITRCYRAVVRHSELPPEVAPAARPAADVAPPGLEDDGPPAPGTAPGTAPASGPAARTRRPPEDPGMQLIDFR